MQLFLSNKMTVIKPFNHVNQKKRFDNKGSLPKILRRKILHKLVLVNHTNTFLSSNDTLFVY